jgi:nicotinamidase-related amidase
VSETALLIMDVQRDIVARISDQDEYLAALADAADAARAAGIRVIYVTVAFREGHPEISPRNKTFSAIAGSGRFTDSDPGTDIHPALAPAATWQYCCAAATSTAWC